MSPPALGQTIAIVDRSGKVISTSDEQSKTLLGVFKEAKAAYRERKAEIVAERRAYAEAKHARRALEQLSLDERSVASRSQGTHRSRSRRPPTADDRSVTSRRPGGRPSRRHTAAAAVAQVEQHHALVSRRPIATRAASYPAAADDDQEEIDMDLAYGELPPADPVPDPTELQSLMSRASKLLDEAHCVQHSVTATIAALQRDPDALAAVALTLAEISNVAAKMAPGALTALKGSFPAVFALLASPQFMIAAGVGVGVVVVMLGGYKIIKKIKARNLLVAEEDEEEEEGQRMDELLELEVATEFDRIESWRMGVGVADVETASVAATSVDAEFITPEAAAMRYGGAGLMEEQERRSSSRRKEVKKKSGGSSKNKDKKKKKEEKSHGTFDRSGKEERSSDTKKRRQSPPAALRRLFSS
ncbi:MAG: hypothetical protein M1816_004481 [Peltula sp. TS41687]|nr:MAG: hypothetical protein M1816_004481 [Peltula sp. TS41687]